MAECRRGPAKRTLPFQLTAIAGVRVILIGSRDVFASNRPRPRGAAHNPICERGRPRRRQRIGEAGVHSSERFRSRTAEDSFGSRRDMSYDSALVSIRADSRLPADQAAVLWDRTYPKPRPKALLFDGKRTAAAECGQHAPCRSVGSPPACLGAVAQELPLHRVASPG